MEKQINVHHLAEIAVSLLSLLLFYIFVSFWGCVVPLEAWKLLKMEKLTLKGLVLVVKCSRGQYILTLFCSVAQVMNSRYAE